jgi:hypothetical protein
MAAKQRKQIPPAKPARQLPWLSRWLGPGLVALVFLALAGWSWRKWPDLLVDFGQQLYVPWQLAGGKLLYKDIAFLHGPFSQHFNALLFRIFGVSLTVLIFLNLAILAGITAIVYRIVRLFGDRPTAATACLTLLCVFGFSQYVGVGNYNYVTPYNQEATHGVALTAGLVLSLSYYLTRGGRAACALAGLWLGLALLTKVDVAPAAMIVAVLGLGAGLVVKNPSVSLKVTDVALFGGIAAAPAIGFFIYFLSYLPVGEALTAVGGGFSVLSREVVNNPFFLRVTGLDDVGGNLGRMVGMFALIVVFVLAAGVADVASARLSRRPLFVGATLGGALFLGLILKPDLLPWPELPRALPLTTFLALTVFAALFLKHRDRKEIWSPILPMLLWTTFALVLLAKVLLNVHVYHYGFYLAMPATLVLVVCLIEWIPRGLKWSPTGRARGSTTSSFDSLRSLRTTLSKGPRPEAVARVEGSSFGCGIVFRSLALAVVAAGIVYHLGWSQEFYRFKNFPVGKGGDTILAYSPAVHAPAKIIAAALRWIEENTPAGVTFVALPEGIMLNYLSRRPTTLPQMNFMMTEMIVFGEEGTLAGFQTMPPDYVVLVHKDTSEWGVGPFGRDNRYGRRIVRWVNQNYEPVVLFGDEPFETNAFGIKILKHVP